jgi:hypothetical protein
MATVPRDARLGQGETERRQSDDMVTLRSTTGTLSPGRARTASEVQRHFTTDDLPTSSKPLLPPKRLSDRLMDSKLTIQHSLNQINTENVAKFSAQFVDKVKKTFTLDESERILREDWVILETEEYQLTELKQVVVDLENAFQFSKSSRLVNLATSTLKRCEALVERSTVHIEQCQLMFSQCSNEILTLQDYLSKLREAIEPVAVPREKTEEKRVARRAEWAVSRMIQSSQSTVLEMRESLEELDDLITECTKLMVQAITLLHMRTRSQDFSGTGVAVGAASVVAGALVRLTYLSASTV